MRHVAAKRVAVLLGVLFVLCALGFAWLVRDERTASAALDRPAINGAALHQRYCASCHAVEDLRRQLREGGAETQGRFETFLADHGEASAAEDRVILDYLAGAETP